MIDQLTFNYTASNTGKILYIPPSTYIPTVGWNFCDAGRADSTGMDWGAFFSFDTSVLPDHAQIDSVSFCIRRRDDPMGEPQFYSLEFYIGSFIGATLDGNAGEWTGGSLMVTLSSKPADKTTLDLSTDGQDPCSHVDKTGTTDIKILDASMKGAGDDVWSTNFNQYEATPCKLSIMYSIPSATATGKGYASCIAEIIAVATGSATGVGEVDASAIVTVDASGSATGVGTATLEGWIVYVSLALHEATISVGSTDSSSTSAGVVHVGTTSCDVVDTATRGPRRAN